jgi:hypothetical protein
MAERIIKPEINYAIEHGLHYWENWFRSNGVVDYETIYEKPRLIVARDLNQWRRGPEIVNTVAEGTRELAFDICYRSESDSEDPLNAFNEVLRKLIQNPGEHGPYAQYPLSDAVLQLANLAAGLSATSWHS